MHPSLSLSSNDFCEHPPPHKGAILQVLQMGLENLEFLRKYNVSVSNNIAPPSPNTPILSAEVKEA